MNSAFLNYFSAFKLGGNSPMNEIQPLTGLVFRPAEFPATLLIRFTKKNLKIKTSFHSNLMGGVGVSLVAVNSTTGQSMKKQPSS